MNIFISNNKCYKCKKHLNIVKSGTINRTDDLRQMKNGYKCKKCGRVVCYECCDDRIACKCGAKEWSIITYS
jgi:uncharacterized Fe-S center protein